MNNSTRRVTGHTVSPVDRTESRQNLCQNQVKSKAMTLRLTSLEKQAHDEEGKRDSCLDLLLNQCKVCNRCPLNGMNMSQFKLDESKQISCVVQMCRKFLLQIQLQRDKCKNKY